MNGRKWNGMLWLGFLLSLLAAVSYPFVFARYPLTRNVPWVNFLLFALSLGLLLFGLRRAFGQPGLYRGKIFGPILTLLSVSLLLFFSFAIFVQSRRLPVSAAAPNPGQKAPEFTLKDTAGNIVSLSSLLHSPLDPAHLSSGVPRGVLLVFYRGYW